eukprot:2456698-Prymnesium_polylepis.1
MVPKRLGEDLCSLHGKVDRLAFSCIWVIDEHANVRSTRFEKTVIRSAAALSYEEAQVRAPPPLHPGGCTLQYAVAVCSLQLAGCTLHPAPHTLQCAVYFEYSLHPAICSLHL